LYAFFFFRYKYNGKCKKSNLFLVTFNTVQHHIILRFCTSVKN